MALSISIPSGHYDSTGAMINASYWQIAYINANVINQTFTMQLNGYASVEAYNANPQQIPLMTQMIMLPDLVNCPSAVWPFSPALLQANYPNNPNAVLLAAQAYCQNYPMFAGSTLVA